MRRADFEFRPGVTYLNGAYYSPLPRACREALDRAYDLKASPDRIGEDVLFTGPDVIRERLGRLMGLEPAAFGITGSTGFGVLLLAQGLRWREGDRLLLGPDEFPSNVYPWLALEERGVHIEAIGTRGRALDPETLEAALRGGCVRALSVGAVHYTSGDVHPLPAFARLLHAHQAHLFVDASQAVGALDLEWAASGADAIVFSGYKWTFGPYGTGAMWVHPELRESLLDVNRNWLANAQSRDFARLMDEYPRTFESHGRRLDVGETASFLNLAVWRAGLDFLLGIGVAAVEAHHRRMQDALVATLDGAPLEPVTSLRGPCRGPMLMLAPRGGLGAAELAEALRERGVHVSARSGRVRLSPGIWNDAADVVAFAEALAACASARD